MRYLATALVFLLTVSFTAQETINYPYNPDVDSDSYVGITDLIELLSIYSYYFEAGEIMVNDTTLSSYLNELTLLLEAAALPEGTSEGQFLKWNGSEWVLVMPSVGCTDSEACNYDETATTNYSSLCIYEDACGVCDGPGEIYECGCSDTPEGDCDCDGNQVDALNVCGGECAADEDGDGICDDGDSCIGEADECGVCNGPGAIYDCGCTEPAPDTCDCDGNVVDAVGECGGGCQEDLDEDGICDSQDDCVGEFDDCGVCNGPGPILGCGCENIPEGDCDCQGNQLDAVGTCGGACQTDVNGDGVCDDDSIPGCTYDAACNYDPSASINDGSCDFSSCYGCTDPTACNYSPAAYIDNQSCWYASFALDCEFYCLNDSDGDGYCDELEIYGCADEEACNYEEGATEPDDSCTYPGCTDSTFCSFNPEAGCDDGSCADGYAACMDSEACNYDSEAICGGIECVYPGCTYEQANNYDPIAGCDDSSCIIEGCNVDLACNFDPLANLDDNSCEFGTCPGCNDYDAVNYNPTSTNDEICEFFDCGETFSYQGYDYSTVQIGNQCWMSEDLKVNNFQNNDPIPFADDIDYSVNDASGPVRADCEIDGNEVYGTLYNWFVISDVRDLCPSGWSVGTQNDWEIMLNFVQSAAPNIYPSESLRSQSGWNDGGGSDIFGFNAKPSGYYSQGNCWGGHGPNTWSLWWSSTATDDSGELFYTDSNWFANYGGCEPGLCVAVRCIQD